MLTIKESLGQGICKADIANFWPQAQGRVRDVLAAFYEEPVPAGFYPHFNEVALRMTLLRAVPELKALQGQVHALLKSDFCAIVIDRLHLAAVEQPLRNGLLYAMCTAIGFATPSSQQQATLLWDVKTRPVPAGRDATYSEHSDEADLHTDSQSYPVPEDWFALYVHQAARCGGGASVFLGVEALRATLGATAAGREALQTLSTHGFPFFVSAGEGTAPGTVTVAPILGERPAIRFRRDVLEKGFQARPDLDTPAARVAVAALSAAVEHHPARVTCQLPDDGIALCDNHRLLHGRTAFQDVGRHLVRVRMSPQPVAVHVVQMLKDNAGFAKALLS